MAKTHKTAVVLIPPEEVWPPIQAIRRRYDRQVRRWMPHVTLVYPFVDEAGFEAAATAAASACADIEPFDVRLSEFKWFDHGGGGFTVWLAPDPAAPFISLQKALEAAFPGYDDVRRYGSFVPHLSVGQAKGRLGLERMLDDIRKTWQPLTFRATHISLIARGDPPDDVFRAVAHVPLGARDGDPAASV